VTGVRISHGEFPTEKPEITAKNYLSVGSGEYPCGNNLYLIVTPTGGRRWAFRYQRNGIVKKMGFGSAKAVGLKLSEAKDKAIDALRLLAKGTDPREHRDDEKRRIQGSRLFGEFAEEWRQIYETGLKHKAARNKLKRIVQVICKPLHKLRLDEIETEHIIAVLRKVWHQREVSRDTRQRIKKILDAAIALNLRPKHNPADWDSRLRPIMPKQRKRGTVRGSHKAMDYHDLPAFMQKLAANSDQSARALEVAILTFARTIEVQNMRWSQLDLESGLWDLGTLDTKNERLKRTPLPRQTLAYLREAHQSRVSDAFVFPGRSVAQPTLQHDDAQAFEADHRRRNPDSARLPYHVPDLGTGGNGFRGGDRRTLPAPHHRRRCRKGLQARRGSEEAAYRDAGIRRLRDAATEKQRDVDKGCLKVWAAHVDRAAYITHRAFRVHRADFPGTTPDRRG
jgi:Arm DNA-binding domain